MPNPTHDDRTIADFSELPDSPQESATALPAHVNQSAEPGRPTLHPIRCDCGRALIVKVDRDRAILRCPVHGIQFRYIARRE